MKITSRATLAAVMDNLTPEAQLERLTKHLELAKAKGMPDGDYDLIKAQLEEGYPDVAKDSLIAWRARETRSHGGRSQLPGIKVAVAQIRADTPKISNEDAWTGLPDASSPLIIETDAADYKIYVDGKKLVQVDTLTKHENSIKRRTFEDHYLTPARKSRSM